MPAGTTLKESPHASTTHAQVSLRKIIRTSRWAALQHHSLRGTTPYVSPGLPCHSTTFPIVVYHGQTRSMLQTLCCAHMPVPLPVSIWIEIDFSQMRLPPCEESVAVEAHGGIQSSTGFCNDRLTPSLFNIVGRCLVAMAHFERTTCTARRRAKGLLFLPVCGRPRRYARHDSYCSDRENPCR